MENKNEWMVKVWGGAFNKSAFPSIKSDYGIEEGYYYFDTEKEKDDFCNILNNPIYTKQGLAKNVVCGKLTHKKTIFVATLRYKGKEFVIHCDFGYEFSEENALFMFEDGDYSCDCNKSLFIRREYGDSSIEELDCGGEIEMVDYHFEYKSDNGSQGIKTWKSN